MSKFFENTGKGVVAILLFGLMVFLAPIFAFVAGWLMGWVIRLTVGQYLVNGLNLLFNTTHFDVTQLPLICATLNMIGCFFGQFNFNGKNPTK